jgi:hypothetical protein
MRRCIVRYLRGSEKATRPGAALRSLRAACDLRCGSLTLALLLPLLLSAQTTGTMGGLAITVTGPSREFAYTNKKAAFLSGATSGEQRSRCSTATPF